MTTLARLPELEWCHRNAAGAQADLAWVDTTLEVHRTVFGAVEAPDRVRFQHLPYGGFQPPSMLEAGRELQDRGTVTLQEALILLFARVEWQVATRDRTWTALSAHPRGLVRLVEAYGVEPSVHRADPAVLARLVSLLPSWYPGRGTAAAARRLLDVAWPDEGPALPDLRCLAEDGPAPSALVNELFACRSVEFWDARWTDGARVELRVAREIVLYQSETPGIVLRREDVAVAWAPDGPAAGPLHRLLPPWAIFRPFLSEETA